MIQIITTLKKLETLKDDWNRLAGMMHNPLLEFDWFYAAAKSFPADLHVVIYRNDQNIEAIAPLCSFEENGYRKLELIGTPFLGEPSGLIYKDRNSLSALIKGLLKKSIPISLRRLVTDSDTFKTIDTVCAHRSVFTPREGGGTPWILIDSDWETYLATLSSRRKSDLRRAWRRGEAFGKLETRIVNVKKNDVTSLLDEVFRVEAASWKGRNGSSLLHRKDLALFFKLYGELAAEKGILRIAFLEIDGKAVAALLGVQTAGRFWVFKIGYDEAYARCSPGMLLMHAVIEYAFKQNLKAFEFLGWDAHWMHFWTDRVRNYSSPLIYPFSVNGIVGFMWDSIGYLKRKYLKEEKSE